MRLLHGKPTVAPQMMGCWHRSYIRLRGGEEDTSTWVIWLQTASGLGDMRIPGDRPDFSGRSDLSACSSDELVALSNQDCRVGVTLFDGAAQPRPTATWESGESGVAYQNYVYFPEPGWFEWRGDDCMIEWAPSGAYEEDWRLQPRSRGRLVHLIGLEDAPIRHLLLAGDHAIHVRDRAVGPLEERPLPDVAAELRHAHDTLVALLDCEFSYATRRADRFVIDLSSLPAREGRVLDLGWIEVLRPETDDLVSAARREGWRIESWIEGL